MANQQRAIHVSLVLIAATASLHCAEVPAPPVGESPGAGGSGGYSPGGSGGSPTYGTGGSAPGAGAGGTSPGPGGTSSGAGGAPTATGGAPPTTVDPPPPGTPTTNPGFQTLAVPLGAPLDPSGGTALNPPAPEGWTYYEIEGSECRDGTPAGFFVHFGTRDELVWYLEGGGACISPAFCNTFNPRNVNEAIAGDGQTALGSALGVVAARQQPGVFDGGAMFGMFDLANPANPYKDWSMIYTPYCTGDVYFGTKPNGTVEGVAGTQKFVGHLNMQKFVARIASTFADSVSRVVLTGASAGSFGAALNYSMVQDTFEGVPVELVLDSGIPFSDTYMQPCMQQYWRDTWGFEGSLPPDCDECFNADGGGLLGLADFVMDKHPYARLAGISSMEDEIIRLFFAGGADNCATLTTSDPVATFLTGTMMPAEHYQAALMEVRDQYASTNRLATYMIGGLNVSFHQHIWRPWFYEAAAGGKTIAQFVTDFLNGANEQVSP
jgi:hypothetical protein